MRIADAVSENELCGHFSLAETLLNDAKTKKKMHKSKKKRKTFGGLQN